MLVEGYPMPDMAGLPPGDFYRPDVVADPTRVFVGYDDGVPVATVSRRTRLPASPWSRTSPCSPPPAARARARP